MKHTKTYVWILISIGLLSAVGYIYVRKPQFTSSSRSTSATQQRCAAKHCFAMEMATTPIQRMNGLMFRERLAADQGMVFVFPEAGKHPFWMKNTQIPLDMIRLDAGYRIVDIQEANPCLQKDCPIYTPQSDASYVIEINQGSTKKLDIQPGDIFGPRE